MGRKERRRGKRIENPLYDNESLTTVQKSNPKDGVISLYMTKKTRQIKEMKISHRYLPKSFKRWCYFSLHDKKNSSNQRNENITQISPQTFRRKSPRKKKVLPLRNFYNS